ncbi:MAG TPA: hypothetical protein VFT99_09110 [Roseiflexaceae bacterium]|nr:hypothetical protein [Roseiflexaceae bacterium]
MERQQIGTYTVLTQLSISDDDRRKLERLVRDRRLNPSDIVSSLLSGMQPLLPSEEDHGSHTVRVPVHVYLTATQRVEIEGYAEQHEQSIAAVLSAMVIQALRAVPAPVAEPEPAPAAGARPTGSELERLRARKAAAGQSAPRWLGEYIAQLEREQRRD